MKCVVPVKSTGFIFPNYVATSCQGQVQGEQYPVRSLGGLSYLRLEVHHNVRGRGNRRTRSPASEVPMIGALMFKQISHQFILDVWEKAAA